MIISNSKQFIFVHITKAAGTSIKKQLEQSLAWNDLVLGGTVLGEKMQWAYHERFGMHKHSRAKEIQKTIGRALWDNYFSFTFVRHPYSRAVSLYTYIQKLVKSAGLRRYIPIKRVRKSPFWNYPATKAYLETKSFSEFIRNKNLTQRAVAMKPQTEWVLDDNGNKLVDYIGKVETIDYDLKVVSERIGFECNSKKVYNVSKSNKTDTYLNRESDLTYLYNLFKSDFDTFNYDPNPTT